MLTRVRNGRRSFLLLCLVGAAPSVGWSQQAREESGRDRLWVAVGAGLGRAAHRPPVSNWGLTGGLGVTYQPSVLLLGVQTDALWNPFHGDVYSHAALLVGIGTRAQESHASIAVGPALASGDLGVYQERPQRFSSTLGLAIQAQLLGLPLTNVGGGFVGFFNFNRHQSFGGVRFNLAVGQLR